MKKVIGLIGVVLWLQRANGAIIMLRGQNYGLNLPMEAKNSSFTVKYTV